MIIIGSMKLPRFMVTPNPSNNNETIRTSEERNIPIRLAINGEKSRITIPPARDTIPVERRFS
jgi:hypothetical protein